MLEEKFQELIKEGKKAFIVYITAGDPTLKKTGELVLELERAGADIIELGIPFSDPLADGPTIQAASQRALKNKVNLNSVFSLVKRIRKKSQIPIVLMTYYNPVFRYGVDNFVKASAASGVDGAIVPDLPPEEAKELIVASKEAGLDVIFFLAPTSSPERIRLVSNCSRGFIYYVSLTGVTGARDKLPKEISSDIMKIKRQTARPVCVGFGVSKPSQAIRIASVSDGIVVGSAIINVIEANLGRKDMVKKVGRFARALARATHEA